MNATTATATTAACDACEYYPGDKVECPALDRDGKCTLVRSCDERHHAGECPGPERCEGCYASTTPSHQSTP